MEKKTQDCHLLPGFCDVMSLFNLALPLKKDIQMNSNKNYKFYFKDKEKTQTFRSQTIRPPSKEE